MQLQQAIQHYTGITAERRETCYLLESLRATLGDTGKLKAVVRRISRVMLPGAEKSHDAENDIRLQNEHTRVARLNFQRCYHTLRKSRVLHRRSELEFDGLVAAIEQVEEATDPYSDVSCLWSLVGGPWWVVLR